MNSQSSHSQVQSCCFLQVLIEEQIRHPASNSKHRTSMISYPLIQVLHIIQALLLCLNCARGMILLLSASVITSPRKRRWGNLPSSTIQAHEYIHAYEMHRPQSVLAWCCVTPPLHWGTPVAQPWPHMHCCNTTKAAKPDCKGHKVTWCCTRCYCIL